MARRAGLQAVLLKTGNWQVSVPGWLSGTGERVRKVFSDEREAKRFAASTRAAAGKGAHASAIPTDLAKDALAAERILHGSGLTLAQAARLAVAKVDDGNGETLGKRFDRAVKDGETRWSGRYARDVGKIFRWLGNEAKRRPCRDFTPAVIDRLLREHGAKSVGTLAMRRARVLAVLNFRERPRRTAAAIRILDLAGVEKVLAACETPAERMVVAVLAFAGIRPDSEEGEIRRLDWSAFGGREIYVAPDVAKTRTDRHVPVTPRLAREIAGHPEDGPVAVANWKRVWTRIRKKGGISGMQDVLRHSFASHFLAAFGEAAAKQAMGHTAGSDTLFRHYRRAVTEADGRRYFE
jgi:integrase